MYARTICKSQPSTSCVQEAAKERELAKSRLSYVQHKREQEKRVLPTFQCSFSLYCAFATQWEYNFNLCALQATVKYA